MNFVSYRKIGTVTNLSRSERPVYRAALHLTQEVESGTLVINHFAPSFPETPFGGVKDSGYGREGGAESLEAYTVVKTVSQRFA